MKNLIDILHNCGFGKDYFKLHKKKVYEINLKILLNVTFIAFACGLLLFGLSLFLSTVMEGKYLYLALSLSNLILFLLLKYNVYNIRRFSKIIFYLFLVEIYYVSIILGTTYQINSNATTFCVFLVALPILIVDYPIRVSLLSLIMLIYFIYQVVTLKSGEMMQMDIINGVTFWALGSWINYTTTRSEIIDLLYLTTIEKQRDTDSLTNLYNRKAAENKINSYVESGIKSVIMIIDLDSFKLVNDSLGHARGDELLKEIAQNISGYFRNTDIVSRLGGDEFLVFIPYISSSDWVKRKGAELIKGLSKSLTYDGGIINVGASIGVYMSNGDCDYQKLYEKADEAMYQAKSLGKNQIFIIDDIK